MRVRYCLTSITETARQMARLLAARIYTKQISTSSTIAIGRPLVLWRLSISDRGLYSFPYFQTDPQIYAQHISTYYHFKIGSLPSTFGYILPSVAEVLRGLPAWSLDDDARTLTLADGDDEASRTAAMTRTTAAMRAVDHFKVLQGWRDELYPVYDRGGALLLSMERAASCLFGIVTYGCHMTAFVSAADAPHGMRLWVPRRARTKQTYPGLLDNTVAGGIVAGEGVLESMVREAAEEASLDADTMRHTARAAGTVTYFHIRDARAGGETRLLQPECQYVYDLELDADTVPRPSDDEVESFALMTVDEVQGAMRSGGFKPNCALVLLDFFIRHGIITAENDQDYIEIVARLHRRLEFPTA